MPIDHREIAVEDAIEAQFCAHPYTSALPAAFDRERAIFPALALEFVHRIQPAEWNAQENLHGSHTAEVLLQDLIKALNGPRGSLDVFRHGSKCFGNRFQVTYLATAHRMYPKTEQLDAAKIPTVTRQLKYSPQHEKLLDLVLSPNGLPIATRELKDPLTGQKVRHATFALMFTYRFVTRVRVSTTSRRQQFTAAR